MSLPLHERINAGDGLVRITVDELDETPTASSLIPGRLPGSDEQYRFHFDMTKCIGCRSCEIACNEQNGNPAEINWRRVGEIEGGVYPDTRRHYLSMGCNHCLDPDCLRGCPVNAYTKDPLTGIVLHSAEACIGCQYCVWNCPYSVPQFNPERGVVGKCDMCHGRLSDGFEPACANACPEGAIAIEIVNITAWRANYAAAESPGMPAAGQTMSTTRITLPESTTELERVDADRIRPEHAHLSLVLMTTLMQAIVGSLIALLAFRSLTAKALVFLLFATCIALNISVVHLGRPAYAWRALKMWRRSWLSREVLLFGMFFAALAVATAAVSMKMLHILSVSTTTLDALAWLTGFLGIAGMIASACIYLVPARPAWNMANTPIDFLLSAGVLGVATAPLLTHGFPEWPAICAAVLWIANQGARLIRLHRAELFERRAAAALLNTPLLRAWLIASFVLVAAVAGFSYSGQLILACIAALSGVLLSRYLFFVSVVPLNMALTFVRGGGH